MLPLYSTGIDSAMDFLTKDMGRCLTLLVPLQVGFPKRYRITYIWWVKGKNFSFHYVNPRCSLESRKAHKSSFFCASFMFPGGFDIFLVANITSFPT